MIAGICFVRCKFLIFTFIHRRTTHITADASGDAAAANGTNTSQDQVDLVKSMTPDERKEYVTNFLRTQVCDNDNYHLRCSYVNNMQLICMAFVYSLSILCIFFVNDTTTTTEICRQ